jgi:hypothetical protein
MANPLNKFAYKDMKINQTIIDRGTGEIVKCLRQYSATTIIDTTPWTAEKEKSLLNSSPDTIIVDPSF